MNVNTGRRRYPVSEQEVDRNNYPPGGPQDPRFQTQPALQGPEFFAQGMEGPAGEDVISGSNNENFFSIGLPYTYKLDEASILGVIELAPNATGSFTVSVSADADFIAYKIQGQVTRNAAFAITDAGSGRALQSRTVTAMEFLGQGIRPYILDVPLLIKAKSSIQVDITDMGANARDPYTGALVPDAALQPSVIIPGNLVNRVSISFVGVKRVMKD